MANRQPQVSPFYNLYMMLIGQQCLKIHKHIINMCMTKTLKLDKVGHQHVKINCNKQLKCVLVKTLHTKIHMSTLMCK